jgi:hypothetical protein
MGANRMAEKHVLYIMASVATVFFPAGGSDHAHVRNPHSRHRRLKEPAQ